MRSRDMLLTQRMTWKIQFNPEESKGFSLRVQALPVFLMTAPTSAGNGPYYIGHDAVITSCYGNNAPETSVWYSGLRLLASVSPQLIELKVCWYCHTTKHPSNSNWLWVPLFHWLLVPWINTDGATDHYTIPLTDILLMFI